MTVEFHIPDITEPPFRGAKKGDHFHPDVPEPPDYRFFSGPAEYIACGFNFGRPCTHWNHKNDGEWHPPRRRHWWQRIIPTTKWRRNRGIAS